MKKHSLQKIELLPESVKHMIAAGEVVQGPFSVIKELVENSIDAGADSIQIMTEQSGLACIRVVDNGGGIPADQIELALVEHATSKIRNISDIEAISSYGFRGEALSSIASVSTLTLSSRCPGEDEGARVRSRFGDTNMESYSGPAGTTVIVEDLFFNTPARKKFLKSVQGESRNSMRVVTSLALARPDISFSFRCDDRLIFDCPAVQTAAQRIEQLFGKNEREHLIEAEIRDIDVGISGLVSDGTLAKPTRGSQFFFVNGRPIENTSFSFHVRRAYDSLLSSGKHPHVYVYISLPAGLADVNVHPAKREIRFFDEAYMGSLVHSFCKSALNRTFTIPFGTDMSRPEYTYNPGRESSLVSEDTASHSERDLPENETVAAGLYENEHPFMPHAAFRGSFVHGERSLSQTEGLTSPGRGNNGDFNIHGILYSTYVLASKEDALYIIDFHAAHERIIYDRLMLSEQRYDSQLLLVPKQIHYSLKVKPFIDEILDLLRYYGFDAEGFSEDSFVVRSVPGLLHVDDSDRFFDDLFNQEQIGHEFILERKKTILERIACHSAKRAGDHMTHEDIRKLLELLFSGEYAHELRCPHGRPFVYRLERTDIEKFFARRL